MGDFVAARLALADRSAEAPEGFQKEGLDVVRLQAARFGALHLFAHPRNATDVHHLVRQGALFDQRFEAGAVDAAGNRLFETGAHSGTVAVADRVDQQIAQRPAVELKFAQHVEDLPAERLARFFEFVEQAAVHVAFARLDRHQVPQVTHVGLPDAVDAPKPLLDAVRVPGKVVIDHQMGALQVDAFSRRIGGDQHLHLRIVEERLCALRRSSRPMPPWMATSAEGRPSSVPIFWCR